jgi:serine/threonine-protein phosphatase PP1 catalytic subunit
MSSAEDDFIDIDSIIKRLLELRGYPGKQVQLLKYEFEYLITKGIEVFMSQPMLLELEQPVQVR